MGGCVCGVEGIDGHLGLSGHAVSWWVSHRARGPQIVTCQWLMRSFTD